MQAAGLDPHLHAPNGCYLGPVSDLQAPEFLMPLDDYLAGGGGAEGLPAPAPEELIVGENERLLPAVVRAMDERAVGARPVVGERRHATCPVPVWRLDGNDLRAQLGEDQAGEVAAIVREIDHAV